jgi:hypothetical protein
MSRPAARGPVIYQHGKMHLVLKGRILAVRDQLLATACIPSPRLRGGLGREHNLHLAYRSSLPALRADFPRKWER